MAQEVKTEEETEDTEDDHEEDPIQTSARIKHESIITTPVAPPRIKQVQMMTW